MFRVCHTKQQFKIFSSSYSSSHVLMFQRPCQTLYNLTLVKSFIQQFVQAYLHAVSFLTHDICTLMQLNLMCMLYKNFRNSKTAKRKNILSYLLLVVMSYIIGNGIKNWGLSIKRPMSQRFIHILYNNKKKKTKNCKM